MKLFVMGFLQVFFISINTYFISKAFYAGVTVTSFVLGVIWMYNVNSIAKKKTFLYPLGGTCGCLCGIFFGRIIC